MMNHKQAGEEKNSSRGKSPEKNSANKGRREKLRNREFERKGILVFHS